MNRWEFSTNFEKAEKGPKEHERGNLSYILEST